MQPEQLLVRKHILSNSQASQLRIRMVPEECTGEYAAHILLSPFSCFEKYGVRTERGAEIVTTKLF